MKTIEFILRLLLLLRFFSCACGAVQTVEDHRRIVRAIRDGDLDRFQQVTYDQPETFQKFSPTYLMLALHLWTKGDPDSVEKEFICDILMRRLEDINQKDRKDELYTPLICAALTNYRRAVIKAIRMGADINGTNRRGQTALMISIRTGALEAAQELLECGADSGAIDENYKTALNHACELEDPSLRERAIMLLLHNGVDVSIIQNSRVKYKIDYSRCKKKRVLGKRIDHKTVLTADELILRRLLKGTEDFQRGMVMLGILISCGMISQMRV